MRWSIFCQIYFLMLLFATCYENTHDGGLTRVDSIQWTGPIDCMCISIYVRRMRLT